MDTAQVCDRPRGQETCPFHKGQNIMTLCKTCGFLVCVKCMTSSEHAGHTFNDITSCLREPTDNLAKHITEIEKRLLKAVDKELSEIQKQRTESIKKHSNGVKDINDQRQQAHLKIDSNADSKIVQWDEHSQQVLHVLDKHTERLESLRKQFKEERKECAETLQKGSNILKYDAGLEITKKTQTQRIPKPPEIVELEYNKCDQNFDDLLLKAMGILEKVNSKPAVAKLPEISQASPSEKVSQHQYQSIETISNNDNESPIFAAITPIGKNAAWADEAIYDERTKKYLCTNILYLIDSRRNVVQQVPLDTNIYYLSAHPITKQMFCINGTKDEVRSIDTASGKTTTLVKCPIVIGRLKVTHDNHFIVGSRLSRESIIKFKMSGELVNKSLEKYEVLDIDYCPQTNRVAISRGEDGLTLLNSDLTIINNTKNMDCSSAIFNSHGNLIVADDSNKDIIVLDGKSLSYIQKLEIDGITRPAKLKLYDNILWVACIDPDKLIFARIT